MGVVDSEWCRSLYEEVTVHAYCIVLQSSLLRLQAIFFALFVQDRFSFLCFLSFLSPFTQFLILCPAERQLLA